MTSRNGGVRRSGVSTRGIQGDPWPPWDSTNLDDELRIVLVSVESIRDPGEACMAGRPHDRAPHSTGATSVPKPLACCGSGG